MFLLFHFLIFLLCIHTSIAADFIYGICENDTIHDSIFYSNLNILLPYLPSRASSSSNYYSTSTGEESGSKVYVQALCRGDVNASVCYDCLQSLTTREIMRCTDANDATIFYELCQVRYSTKNFFSTLDYSGKYLPRDIDKQNLPDHELFMEDFDILFTMLSDRAIHDRNLFATAERVIGNDKYTAYGLAQCTKDLSRDSCKECLSFAKGDIISLFDYYPKIGGTVLATSCKVRYELYPFFEDETAGPTNVKRGKTRNVTKVTVITSVLVVLAVVLSASWYYFKWKRVGGHKGEGKSEHALLGNNQTDNQDQLNLMDLSSIKEATDDFLDKNKLGQGGFGSVYQGTFQDGNEVAIKRLSRKSSQGSDEFKNELILIKRLQHRNLVRLLGCCLEDEEKLLIYEYMPNKSLDMYLFDESRRSQLDWTKSYHIIIGIVRGLLYLHEDSRLKVIHRDLKPNNILLDNEMNAKISDFGMARIFGENQNHANTRRVAGTHGYMAPEYAMQGLFSVKSDVYSFGIVLLEIISGKRCIHLNEQSQTLPSHAWQLWNSGKAIDFMDPILADTCSVQEVLRCIHVALLCVQQDAADRPTMSSVLVTLETESIELAQPTQPAFSVGKIPLTSVLSSNSAGFA